MMSPLPDPPREESQENGDDIVPGSVIPFLGLADDDIMDDGEYELDFSPESDDDDDESDQEPEQEDPISIDENGEPRVRARYRLLIPFPAAENVDDNQDETQEVEFRHSTTEQETQLSESESHENLPNSQEVTESKRDIQLTAESADVIKNAMKGISLPPTAIPDWAKEITEDVWKSRLLATMEKKTGSSNNSSAHSTNLRTSKK